MPIQSCCVCGKAVLPSGGKLLYSHMPTVLSEIHDTEESALTCKYGDMQITLCDTCGAISNLLFEPDKVVYTNQYDNSQHISAVFMQLMQDSVQYILENSRKNPESILEVGCGKGKFLELMASKTAAFCYGYDPSYVGKNQLQDGRLHFYKENYTGQLKKPFDIVILRHVIEHIVNPVEMFVSIREVLAPDGVFYIETPALEWILDNHVIFDFPYEHCSYFTADTMKSLLARAGLRVKTWKYSFSGQYLSFIAEKQDSVQCAELHTTVKSIAEKLESLQQIKEKQIKQTIKRLHDLHINGKIALWGASAKGVMCCNLFDSEREKINAVVDINPMKQGKFIPLTAHPIIAPQDILSRQIQHIFVCNPNYLSEITDVAHKLNPSIQIYTI